MSPDFNGMQCAIIGDATESTHVYTSYADLRATLHLLLYMTSHAQNGGWLVQAVLPSDIAAGLCFKHKHCCSAHITVSWHQDLAVQQRDDWHVLLCQQVLFSHRKHLARLHVPDYGMACTPASPGDG